MNQKPSEQRKFQRYSTEVEVLFQVAYPFKTQMNFQIIDQESGDLHTSKYWAMSKNVGIEGLCFTTSFRLEQGEHIYLEVFLEGKKDPISMEGQVRWSRQSLPLTGKERKFETGIKIISMKGQPVSETFQYDGAKQVVWSGVLQTIFGDFKEEVIELPSSKQNSKSPASVGRASGRFGVGKEKLNKKGK